MTPEPLLTVRSASDLKAETAFRDWVRRLIKGDSELRAFEAGEIDAVMDPDTGSAVLSPQARAALEAVVEPKNVTQRKRAGAARHYGPTTSSRIAALARAGTPNRLLATLPVKEYQRLLGGLELVKLTYGDVLYEPGEQMQYVYFPSDCLVSLLTVVEGHRALEVGLVGREGMVGARLALGFSTSPVRALVQGTGMAVRITSARFLQQFRRSPALQRALLQFTDALMIQVSQTAACNRFHVVEQRLARWLLMTGERLQTAVFHLTHAFLADMLGVRRVGVTSAACALQRQKLIHYRRGTVTILDQRGLEAASCSCYGQVHAMALEAAT